MYHLQIILGSTVGELACRLCKLEKEGAPGQIPGVRLIEHQLIEKMIHLGPLVVFYL